MNPKLFLPKTQFEPEIKIIELDGRLDMSVDAFGLVTLTNRFFIDNNCDCTNRVSGCGPLDTQCPCSWWDFLTGCGQTQ